jgi:hypothetical protein
MTNQVSRVFQESPFNDVLDGLLAGNLKLAGAVCFKDPENHEYVMQIDAVRTNGEFKVNILGLGGYFQDLINEHQNTNGPN